MLVDRKISSVLHDIVANIQEILRSEIRLARSELREGLQHSQNAAILLLLGAFGAFGGFLFALLAALFALEMVMPTWTAALLIATSLAILGAAALRFGVNNLKRVRVAPAALASMKEDPTWQKQPGR